MGNKSVISRVRKRDGRIVLFDQERITNAIFKAAQAVGGTDKELSKRLSDQVVKVLEERFGTDIIPTVEQIQDLVEKTLIEEGHAKTSKAFILYREQRRKLREMAVLTEPIGIVEGYIRQNDWKVNENSNMTYSLQGLNNHISNAIISKYWLDKLYTPRIREAYEKGDIHIHDLGTLGAYCVGWDLKDLLLSGFKGVSGKVESKPPKHFRTALGQAVNFFYTLQGEAAGAMAFSNFDTLLAPFIAYDKLTSAEIKQALQEFIFNMNVPTRVGFQCLSEDTEILTIDGWKRYDEIEKGTMIKTLNIKKMIIEDKKVKSVFKKSYKGIMYNLKNRIQDQLISPGHRIVRKKFNTTHYVLEPIEEVLKLKSPIITLVAANNLKRDVPISDEQIKLIAWIIGEGSVEKRSRHGSCYRVSIYQSAIKNKSNYEEIKSLLNHFKLNYSEYTQHGLGSPVQRIRLNADSSRVIHNWLSKENVKFIPNQFLNMSQRQSKLFVDTFMKAEGFEGCKIATSDVDILNDLQAVVTNAGYGSTVLKREPTIGTKSIYVLRLIKHKETYIKRIAKVDYKGIIWCPNTENETVIARRNGKVFITGNTPFSNITLDLKVPDFMKEEHVLIGGKIMDKKYKHFQREMDLFNEILGEVILEGDASGRVFTFPIPTYNITKDFDWDNPTYDNIWEMTAKYGVPYFSNFINSDMKPDDARSMCPLAGEEKILIKSSRGRVVEYSTIMYIHKGHSKQQEYEVYSNGKFVKGRFNKFKNQKMIKIILENGHEIKMSTNHLNYVTTNEKSKEFILQGKELKREMYLPYSLKVYKGEGGCKDLGYFVGAYAGDGSFDRDSAIVFSLEGYYKKEVIEKLTKIAKDYFGAHSTIKNDKRTKLVTLKVYSKAAVGLCRDFIDGIAREKCYTARLFIMSKEFRNGVIEGHYATDGGNRHRIYTSSKKMVETLNMLAATLGTTTSIYKDEREGRLGKEPNYSVLVYQLNRQRYGKIWFKKKEKLWVRIKDIQPISNDTAYCFEVKDDEPMFTVGTTGILTHNCRLRLDQRELRKRGGGLFGSNPLTGSIGVVTINMARIGYLTKTEEEFFERLSNLMDVSKESLEIKRKALEDFTEQNLYPYSKFYLRNMKVSTGLHWKNHFSTIGLLGMNEALLNFMQKNIASEEGRKFAIKTLDFMRKKISEYQQETGNIYNLEATPGEGTTYRFAKKDKEVYPNIIVANEKAYKEKKAAPFYTNSSQLPVGHTDDIFEALMLQDEIQSKYTGGTVMHCFLGEKISSVEATKALVRKIAENFKIPYFTLTPTFSICPKHGYLVGEHEYCPKCDEEIGYKEVK